MVGLALHTVSLLCFSTLACSLASQPSQLSSKRTYADHGVRLHRGAFTPEECRKIVALLKKRPAQRDVRPEESVSRINYFDDTDAIRSSREGVEGGEGAPPCEYDWIYERVLKHARLPHGDTAAACEGQQSDPQAQDLGDGERAVVWGFDVETCTLRALSVDHVDFVLLHEFRGQDFFDWHIDTKPGDGTGRTVNVNIMLSEEGEDYSGGGLLVGECDLRPRRGDLYWYPANFPHKVADVSCGERHTLVLAVKAKDEAARDASAFWERAERNFQALTAGATAAEHAQANRRRGGGGSGGGGQSGEQAAGSSSELRVVPSKWHMLMGEHYASLEGKDSEADAAFASAYAATDQAHLYARQFDEDGQRLAAAGRLQESLPFFKLAALVAEAQTDDDGALEGGGLTAAELYAQHRDAVQAALDSPSL